MVFPGADVTGEHVSNEISVFRFPKDPKKRAKLILVFVIRRWSYHTDKTVKHFADKFVVCAESATIDDDSVLTVPRVVRPNLQQMRTRRCFPTLRLTHWLNHLVLKRQTPEDRLIY